MCFSYIFRRDKSMLSKEETFLLFQKMRGNDFSFRERLIEENLGLVNVIVKKYQNTNIDFWELFNVGAIGLIKAVDTFDQSKNILFSTYASKCIENAILSFLKRNKKWNCYVRFYTPIYCNDSGRELTLEDILITNEDDVFVNFELKCTYEEIRYVLAKLSDRDRKVILLYFGFFDDYCYSQEEISNIIQVSQSFVSRIIRKSLVVLKEELLKLEYTPVYSKKLSKIG